MDRRMENAEGGALTDTREGCVEEAQPSVRWVSEIEHIQYGYCGPDRKSPVCVDMETRRSSRIERE